MIQNIHSCILAVMLGVFLLTGCGGPFRQVNASSTEFFRDPNLNGRHDEGLGLLMTSFSGGSGSLGEYRVVTANLIEKAFAQERPDVTLISSREVLGHINRANLTWEYAEMIRTYEITGILDKNVLSRIGKAVGSRYLIQPKLLDFTERISTRLSALGLALISTRETSVKLSLQLWDTATGEMLWEGSGEGTVATEAMRAAPITFEEVTAVASSSLAKRFP